MQSIAVQREATCDTNSGTLGMDVLDAMLWGASPGDYSIHLIVHQSHSTERKKDQHKARPCRSCPCTHLSVHSSYSTQPRDQMSDLKV